MTINIQRTLTLITLLATLETIVILAMAVLR